MVDPIVGTPNRSTFAATISRRSKKNGSGANTIASTCSIGAIGCSGGTGSQDEATCMAGAALMNKYMLKTLPVGALRPDWNVLPDDRREVADIDGEDAAIDVLDPIVIS
jgi:hypothetical protein